MAVSLGFGWYVQIASRGNEIVGVFHRKTGGFGFVRPAGVPRSASRDQDIYDTARRLWKSFRE